MTGERTSRPHPSALARALVCCRSQRGADRLEFDIDIHSSRIKSSFLLSHEVNEARIAQNLDVFAWELTGDDMKRLEGLDVGHRFTRGFMEGQWFDQGELGAAKL